MSLASDNVIFQNRMGNLSEVNNSDIGQDLSWVGVENYVPVKYNDGIQLGTQVSGGNRCESTQHAGFDPNDFIFETWFKSNRTVTNGGNGASNSDRQSFFGFSDKDVAVVPYNPNYMAMTIMQNDTKFAVFYYGALTSFSITTGFTFAAGSLNHLIVAYNQAGIGGTSAILTITLNGVQVFGSTLAPPALPSVPYLMKYGAGYNFSGGSSSFSIAYSFQGALDNSRYYNNATFPLINNIVYNALVLDLENILASIGRLNRYNLETEETMEVLNLTYAIWKVVQAIGAKTVYYSDEGSAYELYLADPNNIALSKVKLQKPSADATDFEGSLKGGGTEVTGIDEAKALILG